MKPEDFMLRKGELPARPAALVKPSLAASTNVDALEELLLAGRVAVVGGISLLGAEGRIVAMVSALHLADGENLKGWSVSFEHGRSILRRFDSAQAPIDHMPIPDTMVYFLGELNTADLLKPDASDADIRDVVRFALPFIDDNGPPAGIDWDDAPEHTSGATLGR